MSGAFKQGDISATLKALSKAKEDTPNPLLASLFSAKLPEAKPKDAVQQDTDKGKEKEQDSGVKSEGAKRKRKRGKEKQQAEEKQPKKAKNKEGQDVSTPTSEGAAEKKEDGAKAEGKNKKRKKMDEDDDDELQPRKTLADEEKELKEERAEALRIIKKKKEADIEAKKKRMEKVETEEEKKEKLERTVFIGNIPTDIKKSKIEKIFKEFGKVESVRKRSVAFKTQILSKKVSFIRQEFNEQRKTCNAYVVFSNKDEAVKALEANNKVVGDYHIRVDLATGEHKFDNARTVFVGNLHFEAEEEDVRKHFEQAGDVESVRLVRDKETNFGKGFGYVMYKDRTSIIDALKLNGLPFNGRELRVSRSKANPVPGGLKKKKQSGPRVPQRAPEAKSFQGVFAQKGIVPKIPKKSKGGGSVAAKPKKGKKPKGTSKGKGKGKKKDTKK